MHSTTPRPRLLIAVGSIFVALGVAIVVTSPEDPGAGVAAITFFGACVLVGVLQLVAERRSGTYDLTDAGPAGLWVAALAAGLAAVGSGSLVLIGEDRAWGVVGAVLFGGAALALAVRAGRGEHR